MLSLKATIRTELGRKSKKLRKDGYVPAVLYGPKVRSTPVSLRYKDFEGVYREARESTLISLGIEDQDTAIPAESVVLIRDAVIHPITRKFIHVDFYQVPMDEEITIAIPLVFENEASAVKDEGAVLVRNIYELEVSALPKDLPHEITVDLSTLAHTNDSILVKDLAFAQGVKIEAEEDLVVATVSAPVAEEIVEEVLQEVAPEEIKTEAEGKREEEAKEEAAAEEARE